MYILNRFPHRVVKERDEVYDNYLKQVMKLAALRIHVHTCIL